MATKAMRVQHFGPRDCFRKSIGKVVSEDGRAREKVWYFTGVDEHLAIARAAMLKAEWRRLKAQGVSAWPSSFRPEWADTRIAGQRATVSEPEQPRFRDVEIGALTLGDVLKLYKSDLDAQASANRISAARVRNAYHFASRGVVFLGRSTRLSVIDRGRLVALVNYFCSRPRTSTGKPMAEETVRCHVSNCGTFFRWLARQEVMAWARPINFDEIWEIGSIKPGTEAERKTKYLATAGKGVRVFSIADLNQLFKAADASVRAWLLLGLNCAFQNIDVSDLRAYELQPGKQSTIIRERQKTGVEGRWVLWPETLKAIAAVQAAPNAHERVFLTSKGNPLVSREHRSDQVAVKWNDLRTAAGMAAGLSFKHLRKTSCDAIFQMTGSMELQETHAAHKERSPMAKHYVDRLWTDLAKAQSKLRDRFKAVWSDATPK